MTPLWPLAVFALVASSACAGSAPAPSDAASAPDNASSASAAFADPASETVGGLALGMGRDPSEPDPNTERLLVVGSVYGGTFFRFEGGKLVSVFVGAGAE